MSTNFEIRKDCEDMILDVSGFRHIFVTEDETCVEITINPKDLPELLKAIYNYLQKVSHV